MDGFGRVGAWPAALLLAGWTAAGGGDGGGGGPRLSKEAVDLLRETSPGGECVLEMDEEGNVVAVEAGIPVSAVPVEFLEAADRYVPGGKAVGAEKEWALGRLYWEVIKEVDGVRYEILILRTAPSAGRRSPSRRGRPRQAWSRPRRGRWAAGSWSWRSASPAPRRPTARTST